MSDERWRCFVAVPLGEALRLELSRAAAEWRTQPPADALRWAEPDAWHLTLAFLGPTDPDDVPRIAAALGDVAATHEPFEAATGRLGAFHRPGSVRVLWYGVADGDGRLAALAGDLANALDLSDGEPFRAHVTLARARRRPVDLRGWIETASESAPTGTLEVDRMILMRSHIGRGPARYEALATVALGGVPAHV
jgi:RNA 2',3'-cyclic 3'-phosphodiesterase